LPCQVKVHEVVFVHVARVAPSARIVIDAIPVVSLAEAATSILPLPLNVAPFTGEVIETVGGTGVVIVTGDDGEEVPRES